MAESTKRPDPDELLVRIEDEEKAARKPILKVFLGMSAGVGKTYAMLQEARSAAAQGSDIVVGLVETHGRPDTEAILSGLESVPRRRVEYRGIALGELDIDALISRRPAMAIVDELAHENAPGSRHVKRWQDVEELLEKGISVWTAVNIQHLESYADVVEELTGARVRERVPDSVIDRADEVRLIDIAPEDLIRRLEEGRIYTGGSTRAALENFFTPLNLGALREISLRFATRAASRRLNAYARAEGGLPSESSLGERILVAVGPSPGSAHLVRWTRRTAYALRADWTAVHVETGAPAGEDERRRVEENLNLARTLGAEVVVTQGPDVAETIVGIARSKGVSMIVVGRSGLGLRGLLRGKSTVPDRIIRDAAPIDIALVQDAKLQPTAKNLDWLRRIFGAPRRQYAFLGAAFAVLILFGELASPVLQYRGIALCFLAAVLGLSMVANPGPVAALAIVSALALNYLFIPPLYTFSIGKPEDWVLFGVYFLVAFMTSSLVSRVRSRENLLRDREAAAAFLFSASTAVSGAQSIEEAASAAARLAEAHFASTAFVLVDDGEGRLARESIGSPGPELSDRELDMAAYAYAESVICGSGTDTLPNAAFRYVPASAGERASAVIGIGLPEGKAWTRADDDLLRSLGRSLALAIERRRSDMRSQEASLRLESERLGGILLDSVSHELRTPLTAITGSLSALRDVSLAEKPEARASLLATALEAAESLDAIVEDLLSLSRIESGMLRIARRWVDLHELAAAAIDRAGPEAKSRRIEVLVAEEADSAFVDGALAARLAANLLRNAARYSAAEGRIDFALEPRPGALVIRVRDRGVGLPGEELAAAFDKFARGRGAKGKGLGLGLAICRGIAEAHGGLIAARNATGGGLEVEAILRYGEGTPK
jgi:two-component system, OmpR family, sensor histidine kinase KdpD